MSKVDLHIHSTASDGLLSPAEVVQKAAERGLTTIALADHDSVNGIAPAIEAAKAFAGMQVIPSVEISTSNAESEIHILGYFVDYNNPDFLATLEKFRNSRQWRAQRMVTKLKNLEINIDWQRVQEIAGSSSIGRPHIAQAMLEKGYITSFKEAFTKYIGHGRPAYVKRDKMTPEDAAKLVLRAKGLPVLAHPLTINNPEAIIIRLKAAGLAGIEAYYDSYSIDEINRLVNLANRYDLIATGGSDFHGDGIDLEIFSNYTAPDFILEEMSRGENE